VGRVYWRGLDEFLFVEQVQAISFVRICVLCRRITIERRVLTSGTRARYAKSAMKMKISSRDFMILVLQIQMYYHRFCARRVHILYY